MRGLLAAGGAVWLLASAALQEPQAAAQVARALNTVCRRWLHRGSPLSQVAFLQKHAGDTAVFCTEGTSVNHRVAQKRSLTGAGVIALVRDGAQRWYLRRLAPRGTRRKSGPEPSARRRNRERSRRRATDS